MIVKCVFPGCKVIGEGRPGRPYACEKHTQWIVAGVRGLKSVAAAAAVEAGKQVGRQIKAPWWAKAFVQGVRE